MSQTITPTAHEKAEWSRMATAAYKARRNPIGHRFSVAASLPRDGAMDLSRFDALQAEYRAWLIDGFAPEANHTAAAFADAFGDYPALMISALGRTRT